MSVHAKGTVAWKYSIPFIVLILLRFLAGFDADSDWWGLNLFAFLPAWVPVVLTVAGLVAAIPQAYSSLGSVLRPAISFIGGNGRSAPLLLAVGALLVFWFMTMPYPFLGGDGVHVIRRLFRYNMGTMLEYGQLWTEPLTVLLYSFLTKNFSSVQDGTGGVAIQGYTDIFKIVSVLSGGLFVLSTVRMTRRIFSESALRAALIVGVLGTSGILFFFGYVELYTLLYLTGGLFLLAGIVESEKNGFPAFSTLFFTLAFLSHLSAIVFLPAYAYLLIRWSRISRTKSPPGAKGTLAAAFSLLLIALIFYIWYDSTGNNTFFIPFFGESGSWRLLSIRHLIDIINNLLLGAPAAIALLLSIFFAKRYVARISPGAIFTGLSTIFWFALCVSHSATAHDWDVYPLLALSATIFGVFIVTEIEKKQLRTYFTRQMTIQPLLFIIPWIAVQTNFTRSIERYAAVTDLYVGMLQPRVITGYFETLRSAFTTARNSELEVATIARSIDLLPEPYEYYKLTRAVENASELTPAMEAAVRRSMERMAGIPDSILSVPVGEDAHAHTLTLPVVAVNLLKATSRLMLPEERPAWLEWNARPLFERELQLFAISSYIGHRYFDLGDYLRASDWYGRALSDTASAETSDRESIPFVLNRLAIIHAKRQERNTSLHLFRRAVSYPNASATTWSDYGFACFSFNLHSEARPAFERALAIDSSDANALFCLGTILHRDVSTRAQGTYLLSRFLSVEPNSPRADQARTLFSRHD